MNMFPEIPYAEFFLLTCFLLVAILGSYVIFQRSYLDWIETLLKCHKIEKKYTRFRKLLVAYMPLTALVTFGILIAQVGWTIKINFLEILVFLYSGVFILFLVRAVATTPLLKKETQPEAVVQHLIGLIWVGAIVGSVKMVFTYVFDKNTFSEMIKPLFTVQTLTYSVYDVVGWILITVFPIILVSSLGECLLFGCCQVWGKERKWTP